MPSEWVTKKKLSNLEHVTVQDPMACTTGKCPGCSLELVVKVEPAKMSLFADILRMSSPKRVGHMLIVGSGELGQVQSKIQIYNVSNHVTSGTRENGCLKHFGTDGKDNLGRVDSKRFFWAKKGKWVDQHGPSRPVGCKERKII